MSIPAPSVAYAANRNVAFARALFEENLAGKAHLPAFTDDVPRLLPPGVTFDAAEASDRVRREILALLPGEPWKGGRGERSETQEWPAFS